MPPLVRRKSRRLSPSRGASRPASARIRAPPRRWAAVCGSGGNSSLETSRVGQRHLGAQAPAHARTDTEGVAILHGHDRLLYLSRPRVALATALRSMMLLAAGGHAQTQAIQKSLAGAAAAGAEGGREPGRCV